MKVDFENLRALGWAPLECAAHAEGLGLSRLEAFKGVMDLWGAAPFAVDDLLLYGADYPSRAAHGAATVGLAALVLEYPAVTYEEVAAFEAATGISGKVEALARVDRHEDALRFYDRLEPGVLRLTPVTERDARRAVLSMRRPDSSLSSVVLDSIDHYLWGWVFSPRLDEDPAQRLPAPGAAASPILFDRFTGVGIELGDDDPPAVCVERYEQTGWPAKTDWPGEPLWLGDSGRSDSDVAVDGPSPSPDDSGSA